jgi:hypothetical protein
MKDDRSPFLSTPPAPIITQRKNPFGKREKNWTYSPGGLSTQFGLLRLISGIAQQEGQRWLTWHVDLGGWLTYVG